MNDFKDLNVWQKAHVLTLDVYRVTASLPKEEQYARTSQIRRASASISANIAEGCGRTGDAEFGRFLYIAFGSASELESHLLLARDLKFIPKPAHDQLSQKVIEVKRMLSSLIVKLRADR